jgi:transposase InsO family protein
VEKADYPVTTLCRVLRVSRSGFYASDNRAVSGRAKQSEVLRRKIKQIHTASRGTYGSPRVHEELKAQQFAVSRKRVARLMRHSGIVARLPRRFRHTTDCGHGLSVAANVLERNFTVAAPNTVWATDITYVWTWQGWLYLAVVIDLFSRRVVGWSMAPHMRTELVLQALRMALGQRVPEPDMVHHSDRGSQYASDLYRQVLRRHGIVCSMSRKGNCWDNAVVESFFATLKTELIQRRSWPTREQVRSAIVEYIEVFYNRQRRHSSLGYQSPVDYEESFNQKSTQAA